MSREIDQQLSIVIHATPRDQWATYKDVLNGAVEKIRDEERARILKIAAGLISTPAYEQLARQVNNGATSAFGNGNS